FVTMLVAISGILAYKSSIRFGILSDFGASSMIYVYFPNYIFSSLSKLPDGVLRSVVDFSGRHRPKKKKPALKSRHQATKGIFPFRLHRCQLYTEAPSSLPSRFPGLPIITYPAPSHS